MTDTRQPVRLIVDSTTDVPYERLNEWEIPLVPALVNIGAETMPDDVARQNRPELYAKMRQGVPIKTAAMSQGVILSAYERELERADHLVVFCVAAEFSSIYNNFKMVAQKIAPDRITIFNAGSLTMGTGFAVMAAAKAAAEGASLDQILQIAESVKTRTRLYAIIDDLAHLRRSGRISGFVAGIGTLLQIKPIVQIKDGQAINAHRARTMARAVEFVQSEARKGAPLEGLALLHTDDPEGAERMRAALSDIAPPETLIIEVSTATAVHVGPGCLGIAYVTQRPTPTAP